jgi:hypothetical protein
VIVWRKGRKNPFRGGTGAHERTERLREYDGKTVAAFIEAGGMRRTVGPHRWHVPVARTREADLTTDQSQSVAARPAP